MHYDKALVILLWSFDLAYIYGTKNLAQKTYTHFCAFSVQILKS